MEKAEIQFPIYEYLYYNCIRGVRFIISCSLLFRLLILAFSAFVRSFVRASLCSLSRPFLEVKRLPSMCHPSYRGNFKIENVK